ncbi:MAG: hypothetical protein ACI4O5_00245 [Oscillospiraceae bacterium]
MKQDDQNELFEFTYSAEQQEEVRKIRRKYVPREEDKMERLRRLDAGVTRKGTAAAVTAGVVGALLLGVGMSCCMVWDLFLVGVLVGIAGILVMALAYPLYGRITKREREKIAPEILRLTDELMK